LTPAEEAMKILFFSDVHGYANNVQKLIEKIKVHKPDQLVLLGDALAHYGNSQNSSTTAAILNSLKKNLTAVRGNCDSEMDQTLLEFPMLDEYKILNANHQIFFLTHGHYWNEYHLPPLASFTILVHGHTHIPELKRRTDHTIIMNPGSISLPRGGFPASYGLADEKSLSVHELLRDKIIFSIALG